VGNAQLGEAAIRYDNGQCNGFFFISDFNFQGNPYELQVQRGVSDIVAIQGGNPTFTDLVSGTLHIGNGNLTGVTVFTPTTPPPTVPGAGLGAAAWQRLARRARGSQKVENAPRVTGAYASPGSRS
jgi:hypothetical protein